MKTVILGGAQSDFSLNFKKEGIFTSDIMSEVIEQALTNSGLDYEYIANLVKNNQLSCHIGNFLGELFEDQSHLSSVFTYINPAFIGAQTFRLEAACASGSAAIVSAIHSIMGGFSEVAVVVGYETMKTVNSIDIGDYLGRAAHYKYESKDIDFPFPKLFEKLGFATIERYNLNKKDYLDDLATISNINYQNAQGNPLAQTRNWDFDAKRAFNRGDDSNKMIGELLAVSDCSQVTDGVVVTILCSEDFAKKHKYSGKSACIEGYGQTLARLRLEDKLLDSANSPYILEQTRNAVESAYKMAGINVDDIDCFETHDCFTTSEYMAISAFGITNPGEEFRAIRDGKIAFDGMHPINPSGGLIGVGHPVGASGVRMMLDCYKQVTNQAFGYQVKDAQKVVMLNFGGTATSNFAFVVSSS